MHLLTNFIRVTGKHTTGIFENYATVKNKMLSISKPENIP